MDSRDPKNKEPWLHSSEVIVTHNDPAVHQVDIEQGLSAPEEIAVNIEGCDPLGAQAAPDTLAEPRPMLEHGPLLDEGPMAGSQRNLYLAYATEIMSRVSDTLKSLQETAMDQLRTHPMRSAAMVGLALFAWLRPRYALSDERLDKRLLVENDLPTPGSLPAQESPTLLASAKSTVAGLAETVAEQTSGMLGAATEGIRVARDRAAELMGTARHEISSAVGATTHRISRAGSQVVSNTTAMVGTAASRGARKLRAMPDLLAREPFYLCLASMGAGAVAGLLVPVTGREMEVLSSAREGVIEVARQELGEVITSVKESLAPQSPEKAEVGASPIPDIHEPADAAAVANKLTDLPPEQPDASTLPRMSIHDKPYANDEPIGDLHLRNDYYGEEHLF